MSLEAGTISRARSASLFQLPIWCWFGIGIYVLLLANGGLMLSDSDTYWQISVGQWILDHHALPRVDQYSFTRLGEPWISSSWLSQVLYARAYDLAGWSGPVVLAATAAAIAFALLANILGQRLPQSYALLAALAAFILSAGHLLARPHVLALPVMVAWAGGLLAASDRARAPSFRLLPLAMLWANLHGGFALALVLVGGFALDALWNAEPSKRWPLFVRWGLFGLATIAACCATPYGWGSFAAASKILGLGELLHLIYEWMPPDFSSISLFEVYVLALAGLALYSGVKLTPPRIALVLGLLHMALAHVRNIEIFVLLVPIVVMTPVAAQFGLKREPSSRTSMPLASAVVMVVLLGMSTWAFAATRAYRPPDVQSPAAAVDVLQAHKVLRVFNDISFGGYLIWRGIPVFVDGRAELYGEKFDVDFFRAIQLVDVDRLFDLLKRYDIDSTMLSSSAPAVKLLDRLPGWKRVYADDRAVVHVRVDGAGAAAIDTGASR